MKTTIRLQAAKNKQLKLQLIDKICYLKINALALVCNKNCDIPKFEDVLSA